MLLSFLALEPTASPAFTTPLSNVMARAGQKIKLECEVSGLPPPILAWSHNGKPVKETRELKVSYRFLITVQLVAVAKTVNFSRTPFDAAFDRLI